MRSSLQKAPATARRVSFGVVFAALFVAACGGTPVTITASSSTGVAITTAATPAVAELTTATSAATSATPNATVVTPSATDVPAPATVVPATATALQPTAAPTATAPPPTRLPSPLPRIVPTVPAVVPNTPAATKGAPIDAAAVARGKAIFLSTVGCALCHTINGLSSGDQGPNLTHIAGQPYDSLPNDPAFLRRWIMNPQAIKPGTLMPDLGLTVAQVNDLVAFLETMK